jgi:hypothetical protein
MCRVEGVVIARRPTLRSGANLTRCERCSNCLRAEPYSISADAVGPYPPAIGATRKAGLMTATPLHYVTKHLQQGTKGEHFRVKKNMPRIGGFQSFNTGCWWRNPT